MSPEKAKSALESQGIKYESKNGGLQLVVRHKDVVADFWPTSGKYILRTGDKKRGVGFQSLVHALNGPQKSKKTEEKPKEKAPKLNIDPKKLKKMVADGDICGHCRARESTRGLHGVSDGVNSSRWFCDFCYNSFIASGKF